MGILTAYSIGVSLTMMTLWIVYRMLLASEKQPAFNRGVLLCIYAISFIAPLLPQIHGGQLNSGNEVVEVAIGEITAVVAETPDTAMTTRTVAGIVALIYVVGVAFGLLRTLLGWIKIAGIVAREKHVLLNGTKIVITDDNKFQCPFSWMGYVIISRKDYECKGRNLILIHEMRHISLLHPIDILIAQIGIIVCWFCPAPYLMRSELRDVHEYQADMAVLKSGANAEEYQLLLIKKAVGKKFPALANSLNHSKLKKRLAMMSNKNNSSHGAKARALALVPALGVTILALNCAPVVNAFSRLSTAESIAEMTTSFKNNDKVIDFPSENQIDLSEETFYISAPAEENANTVKSLTPTVDEEKTKTYKVKIATDDDKSETVFNSVEQNPQYPGGESALFKFLITNIKFPESEIKTEGTKRVVVQFVVGADGKVGEAKVLRSQGSAFDNEALRVVKMLPDFIPAKMNGKNVAVWYTLPFTFKNTSGSNHNLEAKTCEAGSGEYQAVSQMPQFPGGEKALLEFIATNIKFPESEIKTDGTKRVVVQFVVGADGKVGETKVLRSQGSVFDNEALRVVKMLPDFIPAKMNGENVSVWYTLPISFKVTESKKVMSVGEKPVAE